MENGKFTILCTGSGTLGGTVKGSFLTIAEDVSPDTLCEVILYAALSALAAYLTKFVLDLLTHYLTRKVDESSSLVRNPLSRKGGKK